MKRKFASAALAAALAASTYATSWTYSTTDKTITDADKQWTLQVYSINKDTGEIWLKQSAIKSWTKPDDESKSGVLDLRSPLLVDYGDGTVETEFTKVNLLRIAFGEHGLAEKNIVEFYCDIISSMGEACFSKCRSMTKLEIGGPAVTMERGQLNRCPKLKEVKFNFPNLRRFNPDGGGNSIFGQQSDASDATDPDPVDVSTLAVPCVTNVGAKTLAHKKICGDLVLTNAMFMGDGAFSGASITNVCLAGSLDALSNLVFAGSTITNVVLDLPQLGTVSASAFSGQKGIRRVELVTALADMGQVTNIVASAGNSSAQELAVYVSKTQWTPGEAETYDASNNPTGFFSALTSEERAAAKADPATAKAFGVLVVKGVRKGLFVHKQSVHDKVVKGMVLVVR